MGSGCYAKLRKILLEHGCFFHRQGGGSHEIWFSPITNRTVSVAVTVASRHTANTILKEAGINKKL